MCFVKVERGNLLVKECTLQRNRRPQPISYKMSKRYCFSF